MQRIEFLSWLYVLPVMGCSSCSNITVVWKELLPAQNAAGKGATKRGNVFMSSVPSLFLFPSFFPIPDFHLLYYLFSFLFLPFCGRGHKMTHNGWRVVKPQHNQYSCWPRAYKSNLFPLSKCSGSPEIFAGLLLDQKQMQTDICKVLKNVRFWLKKYSLISVFSSPEGRLRVSYCDHPLFVMHRLLSVLNN